LQEKTRTKDQGLKDEKLLVSLNLNSQKSGEKRREVKELHFGRGRRLQINAAISKDRREKRD